MKVIVKTNFLKEAFEKVNLVTSKNNQNPSLKCVYLQTEGDELCLRATNISSGFETLIPCKTEIEGNFLISGDVFSRIVSNISSSISEVLISVDGNTCQVSAGSHFVEAKTVLSDDFPKLPDVTGENRFELSIEDFLFGLKSVVFSVAKTEIKPEISGVHIFYDEGKLVFVATDSYRLCEKKIENVSNLDRFYCILGEKNVKDILRIFADKKGLAQISLSENSMSIKMPPEYFVCKTIAGKFPNYKQIIPFAPTSHSTFLKDDFLKAVKMVSFFSDKTEQIQLSFSENGLNLLAENFELGKATESIKVSTKGEDFSLKINSRYLEEFLSLIKDQSVILRFTAQNKPIILQSLQDSSLSYLIMPSYR